MTIGTMVKMARDKRDEAIATFKDKSVTRIDTTMKISWYNFTIKLGDNLLIKLKPQC
jgi:hypothetical protein